MSGLRGSSQGLSNPGYAQGTRPAVGPSYLVGDLGGVGAGEAEHLA